ncbi:helix-turn-helix domain-containing protein [Streptomyces cinnamoneus]|uniref:Transcriptional regulator n=1 Tax=Streptomyces cinnamoneus TaxID=53446 RepID=A0A918WPN7_STRCJ|nr:helix-turn-helix transcriptional regulator [Streptomyces cinnamoneus]GHC65542.1 transcriptional regulator [Streptomyces cinnamoneus]
MPSRSHPTQRQRRLGAELRKLREAAGMTAEEAGAVVDIKAYQVSHLEAGRVGITPNRLRTLACNYGCADEGLVEALVAMADERDKNWWEEYRGSLPPGYLDIAELEHNSRTMRTCSSVHIPGLLQTADHARVIFEEAVSPLPAHELDIRIEHRMRRQSVLDRKHPAQFTAIIHEAALRMQFGGREVARAQLQHLLAVSEREHIEVRSVPFAAGSFPGAGQTVFYAHGPVPQLDTVQLDAAHTTVFLSADLQLENYRGLLERTEAKCLSPEKTRDLIHSIAKEL